MKTNILTDAIAKAVKETTSPLEKRIEALAKKIEDLEPKDVAEQVESTLAQLLGQAGGRSSAKKRTKASAPASAAAAGKDGDCGHKNNMKKCESCRAKKAAAEGKP